MTTDFRITGRSEKIKTGILLGTMSIFCFGLSLFRFYFTGNTMFLFLNWNLFLAAIPWALSIFWNLSVHRSKSIFTFSLLLFSWLLFFPNSPYILTDLIHLKQRGTFPVWYDLILILAFAWTGLAFGFYSLIEIESILRKKFNDNFIKVISTTLLFASAFGVYIGRFLRWNSWDIVSNPLELFYDITHRFIYPMEHPRTWGITIIIGIFLNLAYYTFRDGRQPKSVYEQKSV